MATGVREAGAGVRGAGRENVRGNVRRKLQSVRTDIRYLLRAVFSAFVSWFLVIGLALGSALFVTGAGMPLVSYLVKKLHRISERNLAAGAEVLARKRGTSPDPGAQSARRDLALIRRQAGWAVVQAPLGLVLGMVTLIPSTGVLVCVTVPLWWWALPDGLEVTPAGYPVDSWAAALSAVPFGAVYLALLLYVVPRAALLHARLARHMLTAGGKARLAARLEEVTTSRTGALEAHSAELRRIERDLHDSTQNRLVAVRMHLGIVERLMDSDPAKARELIGVAQTAAEEALAELRHVVRSIYPPILADRGLAGAVSSLAARSPVPCTLHLGDLARAPAAVEVAAYHVVAESLSNAAKHSGAKLVSVSLGREGTKLRVEVADDGRGGATEHGGGTGLAGIRRRVAAFDGTTQVTSPPGGPTTLRVELPCES